MSKSKFCKAGKIECGKYHLGRDADGILEYCQVSGEPISGWDSCPHIPQMEPLDSYNKNYLREQYIAWHNAGAAEQRKAIEEAVSDLYSTPVSSHQVCAAITAAAIKEER
jgi:hypothetical protein